MIIEKFSCGPLDTNAVLVGCKATGCAAVIDPSAGSAELILKELEARGLKLEKILLTHSHWDHIADVHSLKKKTGAKVYVHSLDAGNLEQPGSDGIPLFFSIQGETADSFLEEGMAVEVGELSLRVIHSPGHSPGSVCFYLPEQKILFSGDTLFRGSIGNLHLPTAQPLKMWGSLRKLAALPSETRVIPGHGCDTTLGEESWLIRAEELFSE
ncbi:MAG: MBL fold metallo-hydrolase [Verrucomicrobiota bacterium]|nr:MBL fold metallo-hydrolase [Verrucomicrobiota bacterium]